MSATQDIVAGFDPSLAVSISGADLKSMVEAATPFTDTGFIVTTTDVAGNPAVPDAGATPKWQRYIWRRITATQIIAYVWNPTVVSDATYLKWISMTSSNILDGSITTAKLAVGAVTDDKITSVSWGKLTGVPVGIPPLGPASGDLTGTYPAPAIANNAVNSAKLSSDAAVDANRAVGTDHIKDASVTPAKLSVLAAAMLAPIGAVTALSCKTIPTNWLECDGSAISRATYPTLFALYNADGLPFGAGNGTTTFNLPDLRGEFIRGWDHTRGVDGGRAFGDTQADANKAHTHFIANVDSPANPGGAVTLTNGNQLAASTGGSAQSTDYALKGSATAATIGATSSNGSESRPTNVSMMYIVRVL